MSFSDNNKFITTMKNLRWRLDALSQQHTCNICKEQYLRMYVQLSNSNATCKRCSNEKGIHRFLALNNMDPREQPSVLKRLTK